MKANVRRDRKVKCDERKPTCERCDRANVQCEGYRPSAYGIRDSNEENSSSRRNESGHIQGTTNELELISNTAPPRPRNSDEDSNTLPTLVQAGLNLLFDSYGDEHVLGQTALRTLILRCVASSVSVNAACAALGAATDMQQKTESLSPNTNVVFETCYGRAINLVQQEIGSLQFDMYTILASCTLLGATEIILHRLQDAEKHLRAAYHVYHSLSSNMAISIMSVELAGGHLPNTMDIDAEFLLRISDINTLAFTRGCRSPSIQPVSLTYLQGLIRQSTLSAKQLDSAIVQTIHAAYAQMHEAAHASLERETLAPAFLKCSDCCALLRQWGVLLSAKVEVESSQNIIIHCLLLRNLCASLTIQLSALFDAHETAWDHHGTSFQQVISSSEQILSHRHQRKIRKGRNHLSGFTTQIGVLEPLYLAATRYRNSMWRKRAIACLRQGEREGPWIGEMLAAISERIMSIEESCMDDPRANIPQHSQMGNLWKSTSLDASDIPEHARISFVSIKGGNGAINGALWPSAESGVTMFKMYKRRRPVILLPVLLLSSTRFGKVETGTTHLAGGYLDPEVWQEWQESVEYSPGRQHRILPVSEMPELPV